LDRGAEPLATCGVEAVDVRIPRPACSSVPRPVEVGAPAATRGAGDDGSATDRVRDGDGFAALDVYRIEAAEANTAFVEIQNTMLFSDGRPIAGRPAPLQDAPPAETGRSARRGSRRLGRIRAVLRLGKRPHPGRRDVPFCAPSR
jgi:hypothetical protein